MSAYKYDGFQCIATGGSASINSASFWVCTECGATIATTTSSYVGEKAMEIHRSWHERVAP